MSAEDGLWYKDAIIYELHVKGFTKLHPEVPEKQRGTYAALAHPAVLKHLHQLWGFDVVLEQDNGELTADIIGRCPDRKSLT